ncbi:uncharacterized protein LOC110079420 isoform X1 [Pogona vitticeps]
MEWNTQQARVRPSSYLAVQTHMELTKDKKAPSLVVHVEQKGERNETQYVTLTVQQLWDSHEKDPEVTIQVQPQGQNMPSVIVEMQQNHNNIDEASVSIKVQQPTSGEEIAGPSVTVQIQQKGQGGEHPHKNVHWQPTNTSEDAAQIIQDHQQARYKKWDVAPLVKQHQQPQDWEKLDVIEPMLLQQNTNDSTVNFLQHNRLNPSTEQMKFAQFLQTNQKENRSEVGIPENKLHDNSQDITTTKIPYIHPQGVSKEDSEEFTTELHQEQGNDNVSASGQKQLNLDEGAQTANVEKKVHGCETQPVSKKHERYMPNYFVAIPITNDEILDNIEDVQELIFTKEPNLLRALIPVQTMHLTIIVVHLKTEDDMKRAVSALEHSKAKVQTLLQGKLFSMTFHGIGQFNNQVIYAKMSENELQMLSKIAEAVESSFVEMNVDITGSKNFRPHLTFLKLSKIPALRRKGFRKIREELYKEYEDNHFGTEILSRLDLCAMHKKKQDSGYYHCECSINVCPTNSDGNKNKDEQVNNPKESIHGVPPKDDTLDITPGDNDLVHQIN